MILFALLLLLLASAAARPDQNAGAGETDSALLSFRSSFSNGATALSSWDPSSGPPCAANWTGVICEGGSVTGLHLRSLNLSGDAINATPLAGLVALRSVYLSRNSLSGQFPAGIAGLASLHSLFLDGNNFSGTIPGGAFAGMSRLRKLWINDNAFSGPMPSSIAEAFGLEEVHLHGNRFGGSIPDLADLSQLSRFNVSSNDLSGEIPASLAGFEASSFMGNPDLCGAPLAKKCGGSEAATAADGGDGGGMSLIGVTVYVMVILMACGIIMWVAQFRMQYSGFAALGRVPEYGDEFELGFQAGGGGGGSSVAASSRHRRRTDTAAAGDS